MVDEWTTVSSQLAHIIGAVREAYEDEGDGEYHIRWRENREYDYKLIIGEERIEGEAIARSDGSVDVTEQERVNWVERAEGN